MEIQKTSGVSYVVFFLTLGIVVINLVSLFFPALITTLSTGLHSVDSFEVGISTIPVLTANVVILILGILYYTKHLPKTIQNSIRFILNFEVSRKVSIIAIVVILGIYIAFTVPELSVYEGDEWPDFKRIEEVLEDFPYGEAEGSLAFLPVKNSLLLISQQVFQNIRVLPFIGTISLLLLTYFFTIEISKKRFAGLVAMVILLQSFTFLRHDTTATYSNFWTLFYVLSLYLMYKRWYLSPILYILSIASKLLSVAFLPMTLFFVYRIRLPKKRKILIAISYGVIIVGMGAALSTSEYMVNRATTFEYADFWSGFTTWSFQLRFDYLVLMFLLPVTVGLFLASRKGIPEADSILVLILGVLISAPLLVAFTGYDIHPYRYVPLILFFAVGVGTLLSKKIIQQA